MANHKFNIFDILGKLSQKKRDFSDEEIKAFQPMVIQRWLSGTQNERQVYLINSFANRYCWSLANHKELLINLMTIASPGRMYKYQWLRRDVKSSKTKLSEVVVAKYYNYPLRRAAEAVSMLENDVILGYAEELGYQKEQIRDLKKELKAR